MANRDQSSNLGTGMDRSDVGAIEVYLDRIHREIYGEEKRKKALHGLLKLARDSDRDHLTKKKIAKESGLTTKDLYNYSILETFSDFGIVYIVEKVNRQNQAYAIPDGTICRVLAEAEKHSLARENLEEFPEAMEVIKRFGQRLARVGEVPVQSDQAAKPIEVQMEYTATTMGFEEPVDVQLRVEGSRSQNGSGMWTLVVDGSVTGSMDPTFESEIRAWLKRKMTTIVRAALANHRVCCPCTSVEEHLIRVEQAEDLLIPEDKHYVEIVANDRVVFATELNKIKSE